jgi:hypothetical protein
MGLAGVIQNALGSRRLTSIDVGDDADISIFFEGYIVDAHTNYR